MSSRVITGDEAREARAFVWEEAGPARPAMELAAPSKRCAAEPGEWEERIREAREEGREAGRREGEERARREWEEAGMRMARSVSELAGMKLRTRHEVEREAVELAMAIARRILRRELQVDPDALHGVCKAAMERLNLREATTVRVHPGQRAKVEGWLRQVGCPARLEVHGDASLEEGAFLVETARGTLDTSVATQLEEIERGFVDLLPAGAL